jgi:hypothetical protein
MKENKTFYIYGHYRKDNGELFYIGKGNGNRLKQKNAKAGSK